MKNIFRRGGRTASYGKVDPFLERDTYWDEEDGEYDWDSMEENGGFIEEAEDNSGGQEALEDGDAGFEPFGSGESYSEIGDTGTEDSGVEDYVPISGEDLELDSFGFGEEIGDAGEIQDGESWGFGEDSDEGLSADSSEEGAGAACHGQGRAADAGYGGTDEASGTEYYGSEEPVGGAYYGENGLYGTAEEEPGYYAEQEAGTEACGADGAIGTAYYGPGGAEEEAYGADDAEEAGYYGAEDTGTEACYGADGAEEAGYYRAEDTGAEAYYGADGAEGAGYYGAEDTGAEAYYGADGAEGAGPYGMEEAEGYSGRDGRAARYGEEPYTEGRYRSSIREGWQEENEYGGPEGFQEDMEASGDIISDGSGMEEYFEAETEVPQENEFWAENAVKPAGDYSRKGNRSAARAAKPVAGRKKQEENSPEGSFIAKIGSAIRGMDMMDRVMVTTGVAVLVLAIITGGVFIQLNTAKKQVAGFADVGKQLEGIGMIGETGLMAVAGAHLARFGTGTPEPGQDSQGGYNENGYEREVSVEPNFTSIQKDLKIKFINRNSDKLVANVPFSVTVKSPDGKEQIWSDDDMDGIIHKKDIAPGTYQVAMEPLADEKYANYILFTDSRQVEVKKEIAYEKVNVANEVKKESEVNAAKEDTRKNETVVESSLKDTVAWVESKVISATYNEVAKNTIPDPTTLAMGQRALYLSLEEGAMPMTEGGENPVPDEPSEEPSTEEPAVPDEPTQEPPTEPPVTDPPATEPPATEPPATQEPTAEPTQEPTQAPTAPPTQPPTAPPAPTPVPELVKGTVSVTPTELNAVPGNVLAAKATAAGFTSGQKVVYAIVSSSTAVATATVDTAGNINITAVGEGTAVLTIAANYENGGAETQATASIRINVQGANTLTLDKTSLTVYAEVPAVINAKFSNTAAAAPVLTAQSSDTKIATVSVDKTAITVTGVAEGTAVITVQYSQGNQIGKATCSVTVRKHPREDNVTLLKDVGGHQLYVMSGSDYREATRADYYTADKFFIKGEAKYTGWQTLEGKVYYFKADGSKITGEQVIQGAKYNFASDGSLVTGSNGTVGIDVSKWNGKIDWNAVKNSGISYVIIRCGYRGSSQGSLIEDPKFETNIKGAVAAGLKVGVYFFSQAVDEREAVEEASMVLEQIRDYKISYPVFLDVEASGGRADKIDRETRTAVCKAFCQTIQNNGYTAGIYANKTWLESKIDAGSLSAYKIWLAQYAASPTYKGRYDLWQYRSTGSVSGISGNVDFNISYLGY